MGTFSIHCMQITLAGSHRCLSAPAPVVVETQHPGGRADLWPSTGAMWWRAPRLRPLFPLCLCWRTWIEILLLAAGKESAYTLHANLWPKSGICFNFSALLHRNAPTWLVFYLQENIKTNILSFSNNIDNNTQLLICDNQARKEFDKRHQLGLFAFD